MMEGLRRNYMTKLQGVNNLKKLIKCEIYKMKKMDNVLLITLLFLYPIMWSVLVFRNEVSMVENGHSMLSWILGMIFVMDKQFVIMMAFALAVNELVFKEKSSGYINVIKMSGNQIGDIYRAKAVTEAIYFSFLFFFIIIGTGLCYQLFVNKVATVSSGLLWNANELVPGIEIILIYFLDKCILLPMLFVYFGKKLNITKSVIIIAVLNLMDRGMSFLPGIGKFSIWANTKKAEHFVSLCQKGAVNVHLESVILICIYTLIIWLVMGKEKGDKKYGIFKRC